MTILLFTGNAFCENKLLQQSDLTYLGAFRNPGGTGAGDVYSLNYGGGSMAYNPNNDSLIISNIEHVARVTEISIPELVISSNINSLKKASYLTPSPYYFDPTDGNRKKLLEGGQDATGSIHNRGLLVYANKLIGTSKIYYDANGAQKLTHYTNSLDLSVQDFQGHFQFDAPVFNGVLPGVLGIIPEEYQDVLGGKVITGMGFGSIASSTSYGPSVTVFDPAHLGKIDPVPAATLMAYTSKQYSLAGTYYDNNQPANPYTSPADRVGGVAFPSGTRSVLFFGTHGTSSFDGYACYGTGTSDLELAYTSGPPYKFENRRSGYCYDPHDSSKGVHSYPQVNQIWAYDVNELIDVKKGLKNRWEPIPYATWNVSLPTPGRYIISAAYDPNNRRIFVAQGFADGTAPLFHVFRVAGEPSASSSLQPPQDLKVTK